MVKKCLSRMSWKLSRTVLRRGKGSNPFSLVDYTSFELKEELKSQNLVQSMSRRGNCWDNSPQESFFGHMKDELHLEHCNTFEQLKEEIDSYMEYYNQFRYQWDLEQMTPNEYYNYKMTGILPY